MSATSTMVDVQNVDIDHVNLTNVSKSNAAQTWVALTPLLTVLITAVGLVLSFWIQMVQQHNTARQKIDSDWRAAIEKAAANEGSSAFIALEMQSFEADPVYGRLAKSIAIGALPTVNNQFQFDTAYAGLIEHTEADDQDEVISIARNLSLRLMKLHDSALQGLQSDSGLADKSLANYVAHPERFYPEGARTPQLQEAEQAAWELDSVSAGLSTLWHGTKTIRAIRPGSVDLSGVIFLNHDYKGIDFTRTSMDETYFFGDCSVDLERLPPVRQVAQCRKM